MSDFIRPFSVERDIFKPLNIHFIWDTSEKGEMVHQLNGDEIIQNTTDLTSPKPLPVVDPLELIGFNFIAENTSGDNEKAEMISVDQNNDFIVKFLSGNEK